MKHKFHISPPHSLVSLMVCWLALQSPFVSAQDSLTEPPPPAKVVVDTEILEAFVDEPCHHFEAAKRAFLRGQQKQAANHLRTASAFLQLEAARATTEAKIPLKTSIRELQQLAIFIENRQLDSTDRLEKAFAHAHYALAGHHCVQSAHWCCRSDGFNDKHSVRRAGHDLKAAAVHLERGANWGKTKPDNDTLKPLESARSSAERMIQLGVIPKSSFVQTIDSVRERLEDLTDRKILLAPPLTEYDGLGPSLFR